MQVIYRFSELTQNWRHVYYTGYFEWTSIDPKPFIQNINFLIFVY